MNCPKQVLVVDDEDMIRDIVKSVLSHAGYGVFDAANGREALEVLKERDFDLVITDILMPETEGIETIIEIRKANPHIKIVAVSGGGRANNLHPLEIAGKIGADITLSKPFEPDQLLAVVQGMTADGPVKQGTGGSAAE